MDSFSGVNTVEKRKQDVLEFVRVYLAERQYAPSIQEIKRGIESTSSSLVLDALNRLEADGLIQRERRAARTIRLVEPEKED